MNHHEKIFKDFKNRFPNFLNDRVEFFPNGKNSIRLRNLSNVNESKDYIYTLRDDGGWQFETVSHFIKNTLDIQIPIYT